MSNDQKICFDRVLANESEQTTVFHNRAAFYMAKRWPNEENGDGATIRIGFIGGTEEQKATVKKYAVQWTEHASLKFEFVDSGVTQVRIAFENKGSWSYIGTDALSIHADEPTMNFGWLDEGVILHEFGHMIGLIHEHQNPNNNPIQWDTKVVNASLSDPPNNWDQPTIDRNMYQKYATSQLNASDFDKQSVMLYSFPASWTSDEFHTDANVKLSDKDKEYASIVYPPDQTAYPVAAGVPPIVQPPLNAPGHLSTKGEIFRTLSQWVKSQFQSVNSTGTIKVLFLSANADPSKPIHVNDEFIQIMKLIRRTPEQDALTFVNELKTESGDIPELLHKEKPDIVHFSGHADKNGNLLAFPTHLSTTSPNSPPISTGQLTPQALLKTFNTVPTNIKLVIFNTCNSVPAAMAVVNKIPFCIGTKGNYNDAVAIQFSSFFYQGLGFGKTIQEAYDYADAGVEITRSKVPADERPTIFEKSGADKQQFRLRSPRTEILNRRHRKRITIAVLTSILVGLIVAWLLFPTIGWLSPSIAKKQNESISTKDAAINAYAKTETFHLTEIRELGGDIKAPTEYPPELLLLDMKTSPEERKGLPKGIGEINLKDREVKLMNEWRSDILYFNRTDTEQLLVLRSRESFQPPYKSCTYRLVVSNEVRIVRAASFLVRNGGDETSYRPVYRQMALAFTPEESTEGTLSLDRPRNGESLFILLWVSSFNTPKKEKIAHRSGTGFSIELKDRRVK